MLLVDFHKYTHSLEKVHARQVLLHLMAYSLLLLSVNCLDKGSGAFSVYLAAVSDKSSNEVENMVFLTAST